jgi:N-acylneuraminate cytidylyltransferase
MLAWPVRAALESGLFKRVIVSTEDPEIAEVAQRVGAEVPFTRPGSLADDHTSTAEVMQHAAAWLHEHDRPYTHLCCIYPTTPFLDVGDLSGALDLLETEGVSYVLAVTAYEHPVQRALVESPAGRIAPLQPEYTSTRSQDLVAAFHDAGQFCWGESAMFRRAVPIISEHTAPWHVPRWRAVDIDNEEDWQYAERIHIAQTAEDHS